MANKHLVDYHLFILITVWTTCRKWKLNIHWVLIDMFASLRCDTVTNAVMMQYSRDFKGHLASLFLNENINLGKKYVFDIRRTSKEVYDYARRALYNAGIVDLVSRSGARSPSSSSPWHEQDDAPECGGCLQNRMLQEKLQKLREAFLCMLCCEEEIDAAFCPCGHTVCCQNCAAQLQVNTQTCTLQLDSR